MIDKGEVLVEIKNNGPVLPREIVRKLGSDTIFMGAVLSELLASKHIKISHTKIGGSPVYYVEGQETKLQELYKYLHEKEKKAYDVLKQEKIIRDREAEPSLRVALRNIRDFAKALEVNIDNNREIFWKWYEFPTSEAETVIKKKIGYVKPKKQEIQEPIKEKSKPVQSTLPSTSENKQEKSKPEKKPDDLLLSVTKFFESNNIEIIETEVVRKNQDIEQIIKIPSPVGKLTYFCKIRNKKKNSDKDLSSAYVEGQVKKLPVLYATTGELTKKAKEKSQNEFKNISIIYLKNGN